MKKQFVLGVFILFLLTFLSAGPAFAVQLKAQSEYIVPAEKTINEDVYVIAQDIVIDGVVKGDVFCAGNKVEINGIIEGDFIAAADIVTVSGRVADDVKIIAAEIDFKGEAGDSVMAAGQEVIFEKDSKIGGDLFAAGENLAASGTIGGRLNGSASSMVLSAKVAGDAVLRAGSIELRDGAVLEKDLNYTAARNMKKSKNAIIRGQVKRKLVITEEKPADAFFSALGTLTWKFFQLVILGLAILSLVPVSVTKVREKFNTVPLQALGYGLGYTLLSIPIILGIFITIIGIPLGIIALSLFAISVDLAKVYVAIWAGGYIASYLDRKELKGPFRELALGAFFYSAFAVIPVFGTLMEVIVLIFGLGAILMATLDFIKRSRRKKLDPAL